MNIHVGAGATWKEKFRNFESQNVPHFAKGALVSLAAWYAFCQWGPWTSTILLVVGYLAFVVVSRTKPLYVLFNTALLVGGIMTASALGQYGPLGFALVANLTLALAVEFWQVSRGSGSDGMDLADVLCDGAGWLYLASVIEAMEGMGG